MVKPSAARVTDIEDKIICPSCGVPSPFPEGKPLEEALCVNCKGFLKIEESSEPGKNKKSFNYPAIIGGLGVVALSIFIWSHFNDSKPDPTPIVPAMPPKIEDPEVPGGNQEQKNPVQQEIKTAFNNLEDSSNDPLPAQIDGWTDFLNKYSQNNPYREKAESKLGALMEKQEELKRAASIGTENAIRSAHSSLKNIGLRVEKIKLNERLLRLADGDDRESLPQATVRYRKNIKNLQEMKVTFFNSYLNELKVLKGINEETVSKAINNYKVRHPRNPPSLEEKPTLSQFSMDIFLKNLRDTQFTQNSKQALDEIENQFAIYYSK